MVDNRITARFTAGHIFSIEQSDPKALDYEDKQRFMDEFTAAVPAVQRRWLQYFDGEWAPKDKRGTAFAKRLSKHLYEHYQCKLEAGQLAIAGEIMKRLSGIQSQLHFDFDNELTWKGDVYKDGGSCFSGCGCWKLSIWFSRSSSRAVRLRFSSNSPRSRL